MTFLLYPSLEQAMEDNPLIVSPETLLSEVIKLMKKGSQVSCVLVMSKLKTIADTGIGIPQERMNRLFQPFSQIDSSTTRQYGGTGLGLVISQRLSEMMGGKMWVESNGYCLGNPPANFRNHHSLMQAPSTTF